MGESALVFVYGTLKSGHRANLKLKDEAFVARGLTSERFVIHGSGFPMAFFDPEGHRIFGEVYEVSESTMAELDIYEGYPRFYDRKIIGIDGIGEAWMYYIPDQSLRQGPKLQPTQNGTLNW